jgi:hypothetical protein
MRSAEKKLAYMRQYYADRRDAIKAKVAVWAAQHPDKVRDYKRAWTKRNPIAAKEWIKEHPEKKREYSKRWREKHPESDKQWRAENKERLKSVKAAWTARNRQKIRRYKVEYEARRSAQEPAFKMLRRLRLRLRLALKGQLKCGKTIELLGCSIEDLRKHLEALFRDGMTWETYGAGGWELDHIVPCTAFDFSIPEQQAQCFHYSNLQPLWASENRSKGNSREKDFWRVPGDVQQEFKTRKA